MVRCSMPFTVEGILAEDMPALFDVKITVNSDHDQAMLGPGRSLPEDYDFKGIIDTGSRQCFMIPGLLDSRHFGSNPMFCPVEDAKLVRSGCRGQRMSLSFSSD